MRAVLFLLWIVVLLMGIILFMFFPKVFQALCRANETIEHRTYEIEDASGTSWSTDLYCIDSEGKGYAVGETVGIPFVLIMVVLPFVILRFNRSPQTEITQDEAPL